MSLPRRPAALALALVTAAGGLIAVGGPASAAPSPVVEPVRGFTTSGPVFTVDVGPPTDRRRWEIVGDLRVPDGVSAASPAPGAVLTTNGFGLARTAPARTATAPTLHASPSRAR